MWLLLAAAVGGATDVRYHQALWRRRRRSTADNLRRSRRSAAPFIARGRCASRRTPTWSAGARPVPSPRFASRSRRPLSRLRVDCAPVDCARPVGESNWCPVDVDVCSPLFAAAAAAASSLQRSQSRHQTTLLSIAKVRRRVTGTNTSRSPVCVYLYIASMKLAP